MASVVWDHALKHSVMNHMGRGGGIMHSVPDSYAISSPYIYAV